jgi:hypothetical protein
MKTEIFHSDVKAEIKDFLEEKKNRFFHINKQTTRIGATITYTKFLCDYAKENDKRLLILEPTNAIIEGTVMPFYPGIFWIRKNEDLCSREDVKYKYKQYINVFGYLPSTECNKCEVECERKGIKEEITNNNLIATTYAKVYFDKKTFNSINPDIILMDEFQWIDKYEVNRFTKQELTSILEDFRYVQSKDQNNFLNTNFGGLVVDYLEDVIKDRLDVLDIPKHIKYHKLKPHHFLKALNAIVNPEEKNVFVRFTKAWHSYHKFNYYGTEVIIPEYSTPIEYLFENTKAKTIIISMSKFQGWMLRPYLLSGGEGLTTDLPIHPNEQSQLVICDSASRPLMYYASTGKYDKFNAGINDIANIIKKLNSFISLENPLIFAPNIEVRNNLKNRLKGDIKTIETFNDVKEGKDGFLDYARSSTSGGIEIGKRFGLVINLPWTPSEAFVDRELVSDLSSYDLRYDEICYSLKNCLGRFKDPAGKKPSVVFIYGETKEKVEKYYPDKKEIIEIRQRRNVDRANHILSEVIEYLFLWYRIFELEPDKRLQYLNIFYDLNIPAIHRKIWNKTKEGGYAKFKDFDAQIETEQLSKWHQIEHDLVTLRILGIIRDGNQFTLPKDKCFEIFGFMDDQHYRSIT